MSEQVAESGAVIGDQCEAVAAMFVFGPVQCRNDSVAFVLNTYEGTTHVVCAEHIPATTPTPPEPLPGERGGE